MREGLVALGENVFSSLFAISEREQERGLMFVPPPAPVMSFIYSYPRVSKFWMRNTPAPLDIIFCRAGVITQIHRGEPFSTEVIGDNSFSDLVVELPFGTVEKFGLNVGQKATILKMTPSSESGNQNSVRIEK